MASHLRLFPLVEDFEEAQSQPATVRATVGELLPLLALAQRRNYLWLQDFLEDEVMITQDLHEVLRAFQTRKPSA
jgi:hypothetical protein